jgi:hypothetical protein
MRKPIIDISTVTLLAAFAGTVACGAENTEAPAGEQSGLSAQAVPPATPTPFELARSLDLECRPTNGAPPVPQLFIRQLNPVLTNVLPDQGIQLGEMVRTCTPVTKNGVVPPPNVLAIDRAVNLACYKAMAPPVDVPVVLSHLNPVLKDLPNEPVVLEQIEQFCTNVAVNVPQMPEHVRDIVKFFDFACYRLEDPTSDVDEPLLLGDVNPEHAQWPDHHVRMHRAPRLCVPVRKNNEPIPEPALRLLRWVDFLDYRIDVNPADVVPYGANLHFMNPLFQAAPPTPVWLDQPTHLLVPVAKNGVIPPNG